MDFFNENSTAWNISPSGCDDVRGGLVIDRPSRSGTGTMSSTDRTIGMASSWETGPFDTGDLNDVHNIGEDADGHRINSLHISTGALFKRGSQDAPLEFGVWRRPQSAPFAVPVHLGFDDESNHSYVCGGAPGLWRWWAEAHIYTPTDSPKKYIPPSNEFPKPVVDPPDKPKPGGDGGVVDKKKPPIFEPPIDKKYVRPTTNGLDLHQFSAMATELAVPALLGRPQLISAGAVDLRNRMSIDDNLRHQIDVNSPVTFRLEAFGKQPKNEWAYGQSPQKGKYLGGTAVGGFILLPPEIGMEDAPAFAPAGVTLSTPSFIVHPSAYFAAGIPNMETGLVKTGYQWTSDTTGILKYERVSSVGVATHVMSLTQEGAHNWKELSAKPSTPSLNDWGIYFKAGGLFILDDAGNEIGPLGTGSSGWTDVDKTADQSKNTDDTLAVDTELHFTMTAGETYEIEADIFFDTDTLAGFDWRHTNSSAADLVRIERYTIGCGNTVQANIAVDISHSGSDISVPGTGNEGGYIHMHGAVTQGKADGDFQFEWAQGTSKGTNTTILKGSRIRYRLVP